MKAFEQQLEQLKLDLPVGTKIKHKSGIIEIKDHKKFNIVNDPMFKAKGVCYNRFFLTMNDVTCYTKI